MRYNLSQLLLWEAEVSVEHSCLSFCSAMSINIKSFLSSFLCYLLISASHKMTPGFSEVGGVMQIIINAQQDFALFFTFMRVLSGYFW